MGCYNEYGYWIDPAWTNQAYTANLGTTSVGDAGVLETMRRATQQGPRIEMDDNALFARWLVDSPTTPPAPAKSHTGDLWPILGGLALLAASVAYPLALCWVVGK